MNEDQYTITSHVLKRIPQKTLAPLVAAMRPLDSMRNRAAVLLPRRQSSRRRKRPFMLLKRRRVLSTELGLPLKRPLLQQSRKLCREILLHRQGVGQELSKLLS